MKICTNFKKSKEELYKSFTNKQNKSQSKKFSQTPFGKRIVFVPHCMRNTFHCKAKEYDNHYICAGCGFCTIGKINKLAKELGYYAVYIVKGGRALMKIVMDKKPEAVIGIACYYEGEQGFKVFKDTNIAVQYVPLSKDGCSATDADFNQVEKIMKQKI